MFKKFLFVMTIILTLFIVGAKEQNNALIVEKDDAIEWNNYEIEDILL